MTKIINFKDILLRKKMEEENKAEKIAGYSQKEFKIAATVVKLIHDHMTEELEDPLDVIHYHASTPKLFEQNSVRFGGALVSILTYWNIDIEKVDFIGKEFSAFPTVESICLYVKDFAS